MIIVQCNWLVTMSTRLSCFSRLFFSQNFFIIGYKSIPLMPIRITAEIPLLFTSPFILSRILALLSCHMKTHASNWLAKSFPVWLLIKNEFSPIVSVYFLSSVTCLTRGLEAIVAASSAVTFSSRDSQHHSELGRKFRICTLGPLVDFLTRKDGHSVSPFPQAIFRQVRLFYYIFSL